VFIRVSKEKRGKPMAVYFALEIEKVTDQQKLVEYSQRGVETIKQYGGKLVVIGGAPETVEGNWQPQAVAILEFEDEAHFKHWYNSPEYQEVMPLRLQGTTSRAMLLQGA
jgi:uncharacterized protein (DUF1330 family)